MLSDPDVVVDLADIAGAGRRDVDHMRSVRRRDDLLLRGGEQEPRSKHGRMTPQRIGEKLPSGFYFMAGRKLAQVPDALFPQGGWAVINWLRQAGVRRAEIDHFQLGEKLGRRKPTTRAAFESAIASRVFDFRRKRSWLNPERSPGDYGLGGTRAFDGPRVPGRGLYFEAAVAFPRRLKGGEPFAPGMFASPHWEEVLKGTWASWRGSLRDVPGWGRMLLGEEGQSDYMQGTLAFSDHTERRPRVSQQEYLWIKAERIRYEQAMKDACRIAHSASLAVGLLPAFASTRVIADLVPRYGKGELGAEDWYRRLDAVRRAVRVNAGSDPGRGQAALRALDELAALRVRHERFFVPGARKKYAEAGSAFTPETPLDGTYVRTMVRDLLLLAARHHADCVAISTSETTDRIQANACRSAAHFYDRQLRPSLERELRRWTGDAACSLGRVELPKALGAPRNERPYTAWAARLRPELREEIRREGLPML